MRRLGIEVLKAGSVMLLAAMRAAAGESLPEVFPGAAWQSARPDQVGLDAQALDELAALLGGRGVVVRHGYIAKQWGDIGKKGDWYSSAKPVLSTLLFFAIQEGRVAGVDARVAEWGWELAEKDRTMTLRHLADMTSGYARPEPPGAAWAYNDFAINLYQKTLFDRIFRADPDQVARERFAPLGLEDGLTFETRRRRLFASTRDFGRLDWFWLKRGQWNGKSLLDERFFRDFQRPDVPPDLPNSRDAPTDDYLGVGSYGGGSNHFSKAGPGIYGFNWWFNASVPGKRGILAWPEAPADAYLSLGHGGNCSAVIPSLNLVLACAEGNWGANEPGDDSSTMNQRLALLTRAARGESAPNQAAKPAVAITGERKKWHPVTLTFAGPKSDEQGEPNPFRDVRLTCAFTRRGRQVVARGFFAADGEAAETGATGGDRWRVHFLPDEEGLWSFRAWISEGPDAALATGNEAPAEPPAKTGAATGAVTGSFEIGPTDKSPPDFRALGLLRDERKRYFRFAETGQPFLKSGADSPENFLAFADFDQTTPTHHFQPHARDARPGDPSWRGGRGANAMGALNYLASHGVNALYFLPMNVKGDGDDVWPWTEKWERFRFDVSKLEQWEILFGHMDRLGIAMHVVLQEQENDQLLDKGELGPERKAYLKELVARFSHHPALVWNLGEENTNTTLQQKSQARYLRALDPYDHPIVVHTFPSQIDKVYEPLLGDENFSGVSLQVGKAERGARETKKWIERSAKAGRQWAAFLDEIGPADTGVKPDDVDPDHYEVRRDALWAPLMEGGAGCEWLFGYAYPNHDISCEDFRSRERMWDQTRIATQFLRDQVDLWSAIPLQEVVAGGVARCFGEPGKVYLFYLPQGVKEEPLVVRLPAGSYGVRWLDPRVGGDFVTGSVPVVRAETGGAPVTLGAPPADPERDWAAIVKPGE